MNARIDTIVKAGPSLANALLVDPTIKNVITVSFTYQEDPKEIEKTKIYTKGKNIIVKYNPNMIMKTTIGLSNAT
jgi:hypothetical protein